MDLGLLLEPFELSDAKGLFLGQPPFELQLRSLVGKGLLLQPLLFVEEGLGPLALELQGSLLFESESLSFLELQSLQPEPLCLLLGQALEADQLSILLCLLEGGKPLPLESTGLVLLCPKPAGFLVEFGLFLPT